MNYLKKDAEAKICYVTWLGNVMTSAALSFKNDLKENSEKKSS